MRIRLSILSVIALLAAAAAIAPRLRGAELQLRQEPTAPTGALAPEEKLAEPLVWKSVFNALLRINDKGVKVKTETRLKYACQKDICTPGVIKMVDHTRGDMESELLMRQWQPNPGLDDSFFTVRALQRSE